MSYIANRRALDYPEKEARQTPPEVIAWVFKIFGLCPFNEQDCRIAKRALINCIKNN